MSKRPLLLLRLLLVAGSLCVLGFASCASPLPPDYTLDGPRILAVRSEPPDLVPGSGVKLDALVYAPSGSPPATYEWSWCASLDSNLKCQLSADELTSLLDPTGALGIKVNYSLGSEPSASLSYPADPSVIAAACGGSTGNSDAGDAGDAGSDASDAGDAGDGGGGSGTFNCIGGNVTVSALLTVTIGSRQLQTAKSVTLHLTVPSSTNTNPTISGLSVFSQAASLPPDGGSDEAIVDAAGRGTDPSAGVAPDDNGGIELIVHVPEWATDVVSLGGPSRGMNERRLSPLAEASGGDAPDLDAGSSEGDAPSDDASGLPDVGMPMDGGPGGADSGQGTPDGGLPGPDGGGGLPEGGGGPDGGIGGPDGGGMGPPDGGPGGSPDGGPGGPPDGGSAGPDGGGGGPGPGSSGDGGTGGAPETYESLSAHWYVQSGTLDSNETNLASALVAADRDFEPLEVNRWVPPGAGTYTVIVVLQDNRNGVTWRVQTVRVLR